MNQPSPFSNYRTTPNYPDAYFYIVSGGIVRPWEFDGWQAESLSWKKGCYIHGGLSGNAVVRYTGSGAADFLSSICINGFARFREGTAKHAVMCDDAGLITAHGVLQRVASDDFRLFAHGAWSNYMYAKSHPRCEEQVLDEYLFQIAGPTSLQTLEAATGENLRDVGFLRFRNSRIRGKKVEVMRIGMAGALAYELHGPMADAAEVYDAVVEAGRDYDIQRLGWRTYTVNHVEGGFPQQVWTFMSSGLEDEDYCRFLERIGASALAQPTWSGSVHPDDHRARYRTPLEVGWEKSINLDHDFVGKSSVKNELEHRKRTIVTLVWNAEDVIDVYASLFRGGEDYQYIELPAAPHLRKFVGHADHVYRNGAPVGVSSGTVYSYYYRQMISHCTMDLEHSGIGTEVIVKWGTHGRRIKDVRATVARYPYFNENRNQTIDLSAIPSGVR